MRERQGKRSSALHQSQPHSSKPTDWVGATTTILRKCTKVLAPKVEVPFFHNEAFNINESIIYEYIFTAQIFVSEMQWSQF